MIEQLASSDFIASLSLKFDFLAGILRGYLADADSLKIVSLVLMMLALVLFLFLVIIIYVRHIIFFVKSNNPAKNLKEEIENEDESYDVFNDDEQQELEKELQRELELALAERQAREQQELEQQREKERALEIKSEQDKVKKEKDEIKQKEKLDTENKKRKKNNEPKLDLDWQKGTVVAPEADIEGVSLSYKQNRQELSQLMGLAIDMLGRGVDDLKIAQTLNFKNQGMSDENEIIKAIDALKSFINLSISGKFAKLDMYDTLPKEDQALFHLANGDASLALALLENLMDSKIDKANASSSEEKRQRIYMEVSEYACCFGALAEINDIMLATSAYELAIELQSTNVTAWGRLGDVYKKANSQSKAVWAYQNVLNFADGEIDIAQIANANKHLSEHLYAEGNSLQAAKLYNSAKQYYDSLGINRRLDKQELDIIEIIEDSYNTSLPEMIYKLLGTQRE